MYTVIEQQTNNGGTSVLTPVVKATRELAEQEYFLKLSYAAVSKIEVHSVTLLNQEGKELMSRCYKHGSGANV